jgi:integrase
MDGAMATVDFKFLVRDKDRHGNERLYVRRRGCPKVRLREPEGTDAFLAEYRDAVNGLAKPGRPAKRPTAAPGSFDAILLAACASPEWRALDKREMLTRRQILEKWGDVVAPVSGVRVGALPLASFEERHIRRRRDVLAEQPGAANNFLKAARALFAWATERADETGVKVNPAKAVKRVQYVKRQYHVWTPDELAAYRKTWPIGTKQRLAVELGIGTGQRPSDIRQLGRQHMKGGELQYTQHKGRKRTPTHMVTPILPALQEAIDAMDAGGLTFLLNKFGAPYSEHGFHNTFKDWCRAAGVAECSPHGLRILAAVTFLEAGISTERMMAWFGWRTIKQALHYAQTFNRAQMNRETAAMLAAQSGNGSVPLSGTVPASGTKTPRKSLKNLARKG